jgi:hypothetical protein
MQSQLPRPAALFSTDPSQELLLKQKKDGGKHRTSNNMAAPGQRKAMI